MLRLNLGPSWEGLARLRVEGLKTTPMFVLINFGLIDLG